MTTPMKTGQVGPGAQAPARSAEDIEAEVSAGFRAMLGEQGSGANPRSNREGQQADRSIAAARSDLMRLDGLRMV
jgi:hypothetical protein